MNIAEPRALENHETDLMNAVHVACSRIPPLFDLENFVAVNPFLGWSGTSILDASNGIWASLDTEVLPSLSYYREQWKLGNLEATDLEYAAKRHGVAGEDLVSLLKDPFREDQANSYSVRLRAEKYLQMTRVDVPKVMQRFVARTLADLFLPAFNSRQIKITPSQLFAELRNRAEWDKSFEIVGLEGWSRQLSAIPKEYSDAQAWIRNVAENGSLKEDYLLRLLGLNYGWSSAIRGYGWKSDPGDHSLLEALCVALLCFETAIAKLMPREAQPTPSVVAVGGTVERLCLQDAIEDHLVRKQVGTFLNRNIEAPSGRPDFQVMFCIDVRSEVIRRHLEAISTRVETVGFAGFFGISVALATDSLMSDRCPVLLNPQIEVSGGEMGTGIAGTPSLQTALSSPGAFNLVEAIGLGYVGKLVSKAMRWWGAIATDDSDSAVRGYKENQFGMTLAERVGLAEGILKNSGIGARLGKLVVLCGHGSLSSNNSHAASLDCGACGGHCGALNARMAVEVLNDSEVRAQLAMRGYQGIGEALFVAGQHTTSTDRIELFEPKQISADHQPLLLELKEMLEKASVACRKERAIDMGLQGKSESEIQKILHGRANDWSEVRPEWGLARNSSFIAARRFRTRGANMEGRTFLHDYDASLDTDDSVLTLILSAPVVVASWINLQYFASTVDNERFGCGTKALLNRVGNIGVISGNEGDLRPGLPLESVCRPDGSWFHEPFRLQVMIEAPTEKIDRVLGQVPDVADLVQNGWMRVIALDPTGHDAHLRRLDDAWEPINLGR